MIIKYMIFQTQNDEYTAHHPQRKSVCLCWSKVNSFNSLCIRDITSRWCCCTDSGSLCFSNETLSQVAVTEIHYDVHRN